LKSPWVISLLFMLPDVVNVLHCAAQFHCNK
jgi:hypothetical protein